MGTPRPTTSWSARAGALFVAFAACACTRRATPNLDPPDTGLTEPAPDATAAPACAKEATLLGGALTIRGRDTRVSYTHGGAVPPIHAVRFEVTNRSDRSRVVRVDPRGGRTFPHARRGAFLHDGGRTHEVVAEPNATVEVDVLLEEATASTGSSPALFPLGFEVDGEGACVLAEVKVIRREPLRPSP